MRKGIKRMTSFESFKILNVDDLRQIKRGQQVFLTTWDTPELPLFHTPALAVGINNDQFVVIYIGEDGKGASASLSIVNYSYLWNAKIRDGFSLKTPYGMLQACPTESWIPNEYPGIEVNLSPEPTCRIIRLTVTCAGKDNSGAAIGIVTQIYPNELDDEDDVVPIIKSFDCS